MSNATGMWPPPSDPMLVARRFVQREHATDDGRPLLRHWRGSWMRWVTSRWEEIDAASVRSELYQALENAACADPKTGNPTRWSPTRHKIANTLEALGAVTHIPDETDAPAWLTLADTRSFPLSAINTDPRGKAADYVSVGNGLLHVPTRTLSPHNPEFFNQVAAPFGYDPEVTAPTWGKFLTDLWPDDQDSIHALQEYAGYLLSGRTDLHKMLLVVGPTRAGKGTIGRTLTQLIGPDHTAGPTLSALATNFGLAPLIGKPLAIVSDARLSARGATNQVVERLLSISGEDPLTIDRKFRDPWTGRLPTRFVIMSNELPSLGDASGAIAYRFVIAMLTRSWLHKEDRGLEAKLAAEMPGILNWALDGLARLGRTDRFTEPGASVDALVSLLDQASPESAFVREACTREPGVHIAVDFVYDAWKAWCEANGHKVTSKQMFGKNLRAVVPGLRVAQPRDESGSNKTRYYVGINLITADSGFSRVSASVSEPTLDPTRTDIRANGHQPSACQCDEPHERYGDNGRPCRRTVRPPGVCDGCGDTEDSIIHAETCPKTTISGRAR